MKEFKGAIFDLDGTLIDSTGVWHSIDREFLGRRGFDVPEDYVEYIAPLGVDDTAIYTKERFKLKETVEEIKREWYDMAVYAYANTIPLKKGVYRYLHVLHKNNIKKAIATASDMELAIAVLKNNGIFDLFDNVTTIKEVKRGKGFPDIYIKAAGKMNLSPDDCVVFEDIIQGVKGSRAGGFFTIGVDDNHSDEYKERICGLSDEFINCFEELI